MLVPCGESHEKHIVNKRTARISTPGIDIMIVSMLHDYCRQQSTICSFSATAGLLVHFPTIFINVRALKYCVTMFHLRHKKTG